MSRQHDYQRTGERRQNPIASSCPYPRAKTSGEIGSRAAGSGTTIRESGRETIALLPIAIFGGNTMQETNPIVQEQPVEAVADEIIAAPAPTMTLCSYGNKFTRQELAQVKTPTGTTTHKPIPHIEVVEKLIEALSFRQIGATGVCRLVRRHEDVRGDGPELWLRWLPFRTWLAQQSRQD